MIRGGDNRLRIQMRIELGIVQMEMEDRPDGRRPKGHVSLLDYYEQQANGDAGFQLNSKMLEALRREGRQYYQRYLCCYHLGLFDLVVRDCQRNLRLFRFVRRHARRRREIWRFDQYRPYLHMMHSRALAMICLAGGDAPAALDCIDAGCEKIREFLREYGRLHREDECLELEFLRRWRDEIASNPDREHWISDSADESSKAARPAKSKIQELHSSLERAVRREDYERAAELRDLIRAIEGKNVSP